MRGLSVYPCRHHHTNLDARRTLTDQEKRSYISAVQCLQNKAPQLSTEYAASKSRYDDFQASHVDLTPRIHWNVSEPRLDLSNVLYRERLIRSNF